MSIGLISENEIRQKIRKELEEDIKRFLDGGGTVQKIDTHDARFWDYESNSGEAYKKGITINKKRSEGWQ